MKLSVKGIDHIRIDVREVQEAVDWCLALFDFEVYVSSRTYTIIGNDTLKLCLSEAAEHSFQNGQILHFGLHISNWDQILDKLTQNKIDEDPFVCHWENGAESIYIHGPLGEIELTKVAGAALHDPPELPKNNDQDQDFSLDEDF